MTDLATALMSSTTLLTDFEGQEVIRSAIEIPAAGGGLHDAMALDPVELHIGDEGYVVLHWRVEKVRYDPIKKSSALARVHVFKALEAALIDGQFVAEHFADQRDRVAKAKEEAAGIARLNFAEGNGSMPEEYLAELEAAHGNGLHEELDQDCPLCQSELDALEAERQEEQ